MQTNARKIRKPESETWQMYKASKRTKPADWSLVNQNSWLLLVLYYTLCFTQCSLNLEHNEELSVGFLKASWLKRRAAHTALLGAGSSKSAPPFQGWLAWWKPAISFALCCVPEEPTVQFPMLCTQASGDPKHSLPVDWAGRSHPVPFSSSQVQQSTASHCTGSSL